MKKKLERMLRLLLPAGRYLEKCLEVEQKAFFDTPTESKEFYIVYGPGRTFVQAVHGSELAALSLWHVLKKDNDRAFRKGVNRYAISRRKILSLRKNNPIKKAYKRLRPNYASKSKQVD